MATKNAISKRFSIRPSPPNDVMWSGNPAGDHSSGGGGLIDFTTAATQDPLSMGGTWNNNTQAIAPNVAYGAQSSMRIGPASTGGINIAMSDSIGQTVPPADADYKDSFAFESGFPGNQRIVATMYVAPSYNPSDNHELELLLGCSTGSGTHQWIECGWSRGGARFIAALGRGYPGNGAPYSGAPSDFDVSFSPTDSNLIALGYALVDGDVWQADYVRATGTVTTFLNGVQVLTYNNPTLFAGMGDGIGIGGFRRTLDGTSAANKYGFRNVTISSF